MPLPNIDAADLPPILPADVAADQLDRRNEFRRLALARTVRRLPSGRVDLADPDTGAALADLAGAEVRRLLHDGPWTLYLHNELGGAGAFFVLDHRALGPRVISAGWCVGHAAAAALLVVWVTFDVATAGVLPAGPTAEA